MPWVPYAKLHKNEERGDGNRRPRKTRFYADHNVRDTLVDALRAQGLDVVTADDVRNGSLSDEEQVAAARRMGRVLLTHDRDFLNQRRFSTRTGVGIFVLDGGDGSLLDLVNVYRFLLLTRRGGDAWKNTVLEIKKDGTVSCRWWDKVAGRDLVTQYKVCGQELLEWVDEE